MTCRCPGISARCVPADCSCCPICRRTCRPMPRAEAEFCRQSGLRSNLSIPLRVGGRVTCVDRLRGLSSHPRLARGSGRAAQDRRRGVRPGAGAQSPRDRAGRRARRDHAPQGTPGGREQLSAPVRMRVSRPGPAGEPFSALQSGARRDRPGRPDQGHGPAARRDRHRQGGAGRYHPCVEPTP
ncbi:MAG: hypothetical protein M0C28_16715 [Candidatus Moduliflexus flocculans]|nr:hypothetical protein [Candidatus Moduliflexus flocculans]